MQGVIQQIEARYKKPAVVDVRSGDTVRVHQEIVEGSKKRTQIFEGMVIRTDRTTDVLFASAREFGSGVSFSSAVLGV